MKKLRLNVTNLGATEILSREELKKVLGGTGSGSGSDDPCNKSDGSCMAFACYKPGVSSGICKTVDKVCSCVEVV